MRRSVLPLATLVLVASPLRAQQPMSAEDELMALLNTPVTVASQKALTTREAPGIISLIPREEILASGAKDLLDVLRLVPGFDFASDIQGVVGPAVRGNWAFEGKLLLLVDGQELNETRYGTTQFGTHVPVDHIQRVEVIRGPGSAMYGGFAELAVVNVVTRDGVNLMGATGAVTLATTAQGHALRQLSAGYGTVSGRTTWSLTATVGDGNRSEQPWNSFGQVRQLKDQSGLRTGFFNLGLKHGDFSFRAIHDAYEVDDFTFYRNEAAVSPMRFRGTYLDARADLTLSSTLRVVPRVTFKQQQPWYYPDGLEGGKKETERTTVGAQLIWDPSPAWSVVMGADAWKDSGKAPLSQAWSNGGTQVSYQNRALYTQALWNAPFALLTLGARYDHNSQFGSSFVPRFALTKAWSVFHLKLLASKAFRAPAIENFELNPQVEPEKTTALEVEFGAQLGRAFVSVNLFDIAIRNPIVYQYDSVTDAESYFNYPKTGSRGFEVDLQLRGDWGFLHSSLTVSQANDNQVPDFVVPGEKAYLVGLPNLKATLLASFRLGERWSFAPSFVALGQRFTFESEGGPVRREAVALLNAVVHGELPGLKLKLSFGVHNLTGADVGFPKAYQGTDGDTYPSQPRQVFLRAGYRF